MFLPSGSPVSAVRAARLPTLEAALELADGAQRQLEVDALQMQSWLHDCTASQPHAALPSSFGLNSAASQCQPHVAISTALGVATSTSQPHAALPASLGLSLGASPPHHALPAALPVAVATSQHQPHVAISTAIGVAPAASQPHATISTALGLSSAACELHAAVPAASQPHAVLSTALDPTLAASQWSLSCSPESVANYVRSLYALPDSCDVTRATWREVAHCVRVCFALEADAFKAHKKSIRKIINMVDDEEAAAEAAETAAGEAAEEAAAAEATEEAEAAAEPEEKEGEGPCKKQRCDDAADNGTMASRETTSFSSSLLAQLRPALANRLTEARRGLPRITKANAKSNPPPGLQPYIGQAKRGLDSKPALWYWQVRL